MKKSRNIWAVISIPLLAAVLALALFAAPLWAAEDDKVKGLWLEIPGLPEAESTSFNVQAGGEGEAFFERTMDGGTLVVSIERIDSEDRSGNVLAPGDAGKLSVRLQALRHEIDVDEADIDVTESVEGLAEIYSYPVAATIYMTGEGEDARGNNDIFIFTEEWVFRVHVSITPDYMEDSDNADKIEEWLTNMKIAERD
ncbi:MAG: hypothetical protein LBT23_04605 [Synergistaceae bacterium]|nr:hypothetical protein [Synergistaceae bacterium]